MKHPKSGLCVLKKHCSQAALAWIGLLLAGRCLAIAHGTQPTEAEFAAGMPWAVVIVSASGPGICTGSLISSTFVLTAAHCAGSGQTVLYGSRSREGARRVAVRESIRHPKFSRDPITHDLGLLRLVHPVRVPTVPVAGRAEAWSLLRPGAEAMILGWGKTSDGVDRPDIVLQARIRLTEVGIVGTHIAIRTLRGGACGGDSGGPLLMKATDGQMVLLGVASITDGNLCAAGGGLAGYTNVPALLDFIRANVPDWTERPPPLDFGQTAH
ncbi:MAG: trypsin-like serine protease [Gammaproteobacteria bacterium]